jgi:Cdc6-like AAA superfamily ATPase
MYLILLLILIIVLMQNTDFFTDFNKNQIADRVRPPNVYMTDHMQYTPETIMANLNDVRQTVDRYNAQLPDIIASELAKRTQ